MNQIQKLVHEEYKKNGYLKKWAFHPDDMQRVYDLAEVGLICSEVAEVQEVVRKENYISDDKHLSEELADIVIRTMNFASRNGISIEDAILEKHEQNMKREYLHGKKV